jgi:KipI family sensor histidine kinase inhibitor
MASRKAPAPGLPPETRYLPAGECAAVIELGDAIDPELNARVLALDRALSEKPFAGYTEAIPSYRSLLVFFDPMKASLESIRDHVLGLVVETRGKTRGRGRLKRIPTVYDGEDLAEVARLIGASCEEVIALHSGREYIVYMVGFTPGFAYMGLTDERLVLPRRPTPRTRVPAGSVAIAMGQTGIYPSPTPGGWHLLGRAEHRTLFDLERDPPSFFLPGDHVRFDPVDSLPELRESETKPKPKSKPPGGGAHVEVLDGGLFTTVQDQGRPFYQRYGVPVAGAVDGPALRAANLLVGNPPGAAGLECTVHGPALRALRPLVAAVTGADLGAVVERSDLGRWRAPLQTSFFLRPGNVLRFEGRRSGARAYVAFAGGVDVPLVLGSRSTYGTGGLGGIEGRRLEAGDRFAIGPCESIPPAGRRWPEEKRDENAAASIRVVLGPQADRFKADALATFTSSIYRVAPSSDRMGYRLEGPTLEHLGPKEIVSDGMMLGGIQVPPNGLPIVMLADRATMGGYPKVATVITADLPRLAQLIPGDCLQFQSVSLEEARAAYRASFDLDRVRERRL